MTVEQFFETSIQSEGVFHLKHDTIKTSLAEWEWYYYDTLIARCFIESKSVELYKLGYSTSTTRRHNIVRRFYRYRLETIDMYR